MQGDLVAGLGALGVGVVRVPDGQIEGALATDAVDNAYNLAN